MGAEKKIFQLDTSDNMGDVTLLDALAFARLINVLLKREGISKFVTFEEEFHSSEYNKHNRDEKA